MQFDIIQLDHEAIMKTLLSELSSMIQVHNTLKDSRDAIEIISQLQVTLAISKIPEIVPFDEEEQTTISRTLAQLIPSHADVTNILEKSPSDFDFFISLQKAKNCLEELRSKLKNEHFTEMHSLIYQIVNFGRSKLFNELQQFIFQLFELSGVEDTSQNLAQNHVYPIGSYSSHRQLSAVQDLAYESLRVFQNTYFQNKQFIQKLRFMEADQSSLLRTKFFQPYIYIVQNYYQAQYSEKMARLDSQISLNDDEDRTFYSEVLAMRPGRQFALPEQSDLNKHPMQEIILITQQSSNNYPFLSELNRLFSTYQIAPFQVQTRRLQQNYLLSREKFVRMLRQLKFEELFNVINIEITSTNSSKLFGKHFEKKLPEFVRNCEVAGGTIQEISVSMELFHLIMHVFVDFNFEAIVIQKILGNGADAHAYAQQIFSQVEPKIQLFVKARVNSTAMPQLLLLLDLIRHLDNMIGTDQLYIKEVFGNLKTSMINAYQAKFKCLGDIFGRNFMHEKMVKSALEKNLQHVAIMPTFATLQLGYIMQNNFQYFPELNFELVLQYFEHLDTLSQLFEIFYGEVFYVNNFYIVQQVLEDFIALEEEENIGGFKWCQQTITSHLKLHLHSLQSFRENQGLWKLLQEEPYLIPFQQLRQEVMRK